MYYIFLADGFEEIEALTQVDVLRRAKIDIKTVGVTGAKVTGSHGIEVSADITIDKASATPDGIILPGGMPGTLNLKKSQEVSLIIKSTVARGGLVAAICAAPSVIGEMGLLKGKKATCYPGYEDKLLGATVTFDNVVADKNFITSRGAGTSLDFAYAIVEYVTGQSASQLKEAMIYA